MIYGKMQTLSMKAGTLQENTLHLIIILVNQIYIAFIIVQLLELVVFKNYTPIGTSHFFMLIVMFVVSLHIRKDI